MAPTWHKPQTRTGHDPGPRALQVLPQPLPTGPGHVGSAVRAVAKLVLNSTPVHTSCLPAAKKGSHPKGLGQAFSTSALVVFLGQMTLCDGGMSCAL